MPTNDLDNNEDDPLEQREEIEEVERWTFALASDGDIIMNEGNTFGTVDNDMAAIQGLKVSVATRQGEDPMDPGFGLDIFRATTTTQLLKSEVRQTLEYDDFDHDRVRYVEDVHIDRRPGTRQATVIATIVLDRGDEIQLTFSLGRRRGRGDLIITP